MRRWVEMWKPSRRRYGHRCIRENQSMTSACVCDTGGKNARSGLGIVAFSTGMHIPVLFHPLKELEVILHFAPRNTTAFVRPSFVCKLAGTRNPIHILDEPVHRYRLLESHTHRQHIKKGGGNNQTHLFNLVPCKRFL